MKPKSRVMRDEAHWGRVGMNRTLIILALVFLLLVAGAATLIAQSDVFSIPSAVSATTYLTDHSGVLDNGSIRLDDKFYEYLGYYNYPESYDHGWGWRSRGFQFSPLAGFLWGLLSLIGALVLSVAVVALLPKQTEVLADTIEHEPLASLGIGLLASVLIPLVFVALLIIIIVGWILIPFVAIAIPVLYFYGSVGVGRWLGRRIIDTTHFVADSPIAEVVTGILILGLIGLIPLVGWAVQGIALLFGFGAVFLSRFGAGDPWFRAKSSPSATPQTPPQEPSVSQPPESQPTETTELPKDRPSPEDRSEIGT